MHHGMRDQGFHRMSIPAKSGQFRVVVIPFEGRNRCLADAKSVSYILLGQALRLAQLNEITNKIKIRLDERISATLGF